MSFTVQLLICIELFSEPGPFKTGMTNLPQITASNLLSIPKLFYRRLKWYYLFIRSFGRINRILIINPADIEYGQTPESQFPPKKFLGGYRDGDWDKKVLPVESHLLYDSFIQHFQHSEPWENTRFFQFALDSINMGKPFRGEYDSYESLLIRFKKCDQLYRTIEKNGYKSNRQLYSEGKIRNILELLDEVTVNIDRDGNLILNDGWHRFATARILNVPKITVRLCATHILAK